MDLKESLKGHTGELRRGKGRKELCNYIIISKKKERAVAIFRQSVTCLYHQGQQQRSERRLGAINKIVGNENL